MISFPLCAGASAAVPLLCFVVVKHSKVPTASTDVNLEDLERVKPAPQPCRDSVGPALPHSPLLTPCREPGRAQTKQQLLISERGKLLKEGCGHQNSWSSAQKLPKGIFGTLQAEVGIRWVQQDGR